MTSPAVQALLEERGDFRLDECLMLWRRPDGQRERQLVVNVGHYLPHPSAVAQWAQRPGRIEGVLERATFDSWLPQAERLLRVVVEPGTEPVVTVVDVSGSEEAAGPEHLGELALIQRIRAAWVRLSPAAEGADSAEAMGILEGAAEELPAYRPAHDGLVRGLLLQDRADEALQALDQAMTHHPVWALTRRGDVLDDLDRLDEALAELDTAVALGPADGYARLIRGIVRRRAEHPGASQDLALARELGPRQVAAWIHGAAIIQQHHGTARALELLRDGLVYNPDDIELVGLHDHLVESMLTKHRPEQVLAWAHPTLNALDAIATEALVRDENVLFRRLAERVLALDPSHARMLYNLSCIEEDPGEALVLTRRALHADDGYRPALVALPGRLAAVAGSQPTEEDVEVAVPDVPGISLPATLTFHVSTPSRGAVLPAAGSELGALVLALKAWNQQVELGDELRQGVLLLPEHPPQAVLELACAAWVRPSDGGPLLRLGRVPIYVGAGDEREELWVEVDEPFVLEE